MADHVALDQAWRTYCASEIQSGKDWPSKFGYLVDAYRQLAHDQEAVTMRRTNRRRFSMTSYGASFGGEPGTSASASAASDEGEDRPFTPEDVKLPPISAAATQPLQRTRRFPLTASQRFGSRVTSLEIYGREARGKQTVEKTLGWPTM